MDARCPPDDSRPVLLTASSAASLQMLSVLTALALPSRTSLQASCRFRPVGEWPRRFSSARSASQLNSITKSSSHFSAGLRGTIMASNRSESARRGATCRAEALAASPALLATAERSLEAAELPACASAMRPCPATVGAPAVVSSSSSRHAPHSPDWFRSTPVSSIRYLKIG